jgi:hypothetical protein
MIEIVINRNERLIEKCQDEAKKNHQQKLWRDQQQVLEDSQKAILETIRESSNSIEEERI